MKDFQNWSKEIQQMDFDGYSKAIRDIIIEKGDIDQKSKQYFYDCYDYVFKLYKQNKPLETNLLYIYLTKIKGYKTLNIQEFTIVILLLSLCGFQIEKMGEEK